MGNLLKNIVVSFVVRCIIYLPVIIAASTTAVESKEGSTEQILHHGAEHLQTSYHVATPTATYQKYNGQETDSLRNEEYGLLRRSTREDYQTKPDSEHPLSLEEFQRIFRKYLQLLQKSKHYSMDDKDEDFPDNSPGRNSERDNVNTQSGNINVYIKGNVQIRGNVNIDTSGQGNGVRNTHDNLEKDPSAIHPIIVENETDDSDVVTIPRKTKGTANQRQGSQIIVPTKSSTRNLRTPPPPPYNPTQKIASNV